MVFVGFCWFFLLFLLVFVGFFLSFVVVGFCCLLFVFVFVFVFVYLLFVFFVGFLVY